MSDHPPRIRPSTAALPTTFAMAAALVLAPAGAGPASADPPAPVEHAAEVTLVTGDRVMVAPGPAGARLGTVLPAPRESGPVGYETIEYDDRTYLIPDDAAGPIADGVLDRELFNVTKLYEYGFHGDRGLPVIVTGALPAAASAGPLVHSARPLPSIDGAAFTLDTATSGPAVDWWRAGPAAAGIRSGGLRVWLDEPARPNLDRSVHQVGAPTAWDEGFDGTGVTVAVLDTGVDGDHPDLAGKLREQRNFTADPDAGDLVGHGTHVAATVAGTGDPYRGVAPGADLLNGKVCTAESCPTSAIIGGMEWAAERGADVVNLSLGCGPSNGCFDNDGSDPLSQALNQLTAAHGVLFVVAAGNDGADRAVGRPAVADAALAVGAVTRNDALADFSSRGPRAGDFAVKPEIAAPGFGIVAARAAGTDPGNPVGDQHTALNGTSMATPHVAGAAAVLVQQYPQWSPAELAAALVGSAADVGLPVYAAGGGRLDLARAVGTQVLAAPATVSFGRADSGNHTRTVTLANHSGATLDLDLSVSSADPGLVTVDPAEVSLPAGGTAPVTLTLDADAATGSSYEGRLLARDAAGALAVTVPVAAVTAPDVQLAVELVGFDGQPHQDVTDLRVFPVDRDGAEILVRFVGGRTSLTLPPGAYQVQVLDRGVPHPDLVPASVVAVDPELVLTDDTTWTVDFRELSPLRVDLPEPADPALQLVGVHRESAAGTRAFRNQVYTSADRVYVLPGEGRVEEGTFTFSYTPTLIRSQLDLAIGDLTVHPRYYDYSGGFDELELARFDGRRALDLHDLGAGTPEDFAATEVAGALVLLAGDTTPGAGQRALIEAIGRAADAGAAGVVYFDTAAPTRRLRNNGDRLPVTHLDHRDGLRLRDALTGGTGRAELTGFPDSPFAYYLHYPERGRVTPDTTYTADPSELVARETAYHAGGDSYVRKGYLASPAGQELPAIPIVFVSSFRAPVTRTDYYGPVDPELRWARLIFPTLTDPLFTWSARETFATPGRTGESWGAAPVRPGQPVPGPVEDPQAYLASRDGNTLWTAAQLIDGHGRGHLGGSFARALLPGLHHVDWQLTRDGEAIPARPGPSGLSLFDLPSESARYDLRLRYEPPDRLLGTRSETTWRFRSAEVVDGTDVAGMSCGGGRWSVPAGPCQPVPLLLLDYEAELDLRDTTPRPGAHQLTLRGYHLPGAPDPAVVHMRAWASYDGGDGWAEVRVLRRPDGSYRALVPPTRTGGPLSLRVWAVDAAGSEVTQTVYDAYQVRPTGRQ